MDIKELYNSSNIFINEIIQKKYLLSSEYSYTDMIEKRFLPYLNNNKIDAKNILLNKRFIPGGSILRGFLNPAKVSMSNCYVLMPETDSLESIFELCKKMAKTYSYSGGVGYDISILRPKDCIVNNSAKYSTGSVSFLPVFDTVTRTIGQNGRRGAALAAIQDWHPDLLDFIKAKANPELVFNRDNITGELPTISYTNISVKLSDDFMKAVELDKDWKLLFPDTKSEEYKFWDGNINKWLKEDKPVIVYKTLKAREILKLIADCSYKCGDPGILFWDNHKKYSTVNFNNKTVVENVNPCGEQSLHNNSSCNLGVLVLYKYVLHPFSNRAEFNYVLFEQDCKLAVKIMNSLLDESIKKHPLEEQTKQSAYERRIGIGITGLADCLAMMNLKYNNSKETLDFIEKIMQRKCKVEWETSVEIAKEMGCAPALSDTAMRKDFLNQEQIKFYLQFLNKNFKNVLMEYGARNIAISTIQPAGTLSIIADNCTSGIEPLFSIKYKRKTRVEGNPEIELIHPVLLEYIYKNDLTEDLDLSIDDLCKKYNYIEAHNVDFGSRIEIQALIQKYVDTAISSTVNLPESISIDTIYDLYTVSHKMGLKGVTIFRDGCKTGVLESSEKDSEKLNVSENSKNPVLTKEEYLNIIKFCEKNNYNAETTLAFIESYLKVGKIFKNSEEFSNWIQNLDNNDIKKDNNDNDVYQVEKNGLYEIELLDEEDAVRYRVKWKNNIKVYINVTVDKDENKPLETFVSLPYEAGIDERGEFSSALYLERKSDWDCINRLISVLLRFNIPLVEIIEQLQKTSYTMFDLSALMRRVLSKFIVKPEDKDTEEDFVTYEDEEVNDDWDVTSSDDLDDNMSKEDMQKIADRVKKIDSGEAKTYTIDEVKEKLGVSSVKNNSNICPECHNKSLIYEGGCWKCLNCFYSKCD